MSSAPSTSSDAWLPVLADAGISEEAAVLSAVATQPLYVLAAQVVDDRMGVMSALKVAGVQTYGHRQRMANALSKFWKRLVDASFAEISPLENSQYPMVTPLLTITPEADYS